MQVSVHGLVASRIVSALTLSRSPRGLHVRVKLLQILLPPRVAEGLRADIHRSLRVPRTSSAGECSSVSVSRGTPPRRCSQSGRALVADELGAVARGSTLSAWQSCSFCDIVAGRGARGEARTFFIPVTGRAVHASFLVTVAPAVSHVPTRCGGISRPSAEVAFPFNFCRRFPLRW